MCSGWWWWWWFWHGGWEEGQEPLGCGGGPPRHQADFIVSQSVKIRQGATFSLRREHPVLKQKLPTAPRRVRQKDLGAEGLSRSQGYFDLWSGLVCVIHFHSWVSFLLSYFHDDVLLFCKELILQNWSKKDQEKLVGAIIPVRKLKSIGNFKVTSRVPFTPFIFEFNFIV